MFFSLIFSFFFFVCMQGPIGLDGPKGEPVSLKSPYFNIFSFLYLNVNFLSCAKLQWFTVCHSFFSEFDWMWQMSSFPLLWQRKWFLLTDQMNCVHYHHYSHSHTHTHETYHFMNSVPMRLSICSAIVSMAFIFLSSINKKYNQVVCIDVDIPFGKWEPWEEANSLVFMELLYTL